MSIDVEVVLYQVVAVLLPISVYHLFFYEKDSQRRKPYSKLSIILIFILVLTMSLPVKFSEGYVYDFRIVPFIIAFVYGGTVPGLLAAVVVLGYRYLIGGDGFYVVLVNYSLTCAVFILMRNQYESFKKKNKLMFVSLVFWVNTIIVILTLFTKNQIEQIPFMFAFYFITWICLMMVVFIMENVNQQIEMREKLQKDERLNVISQLAASVAHEVRNPLTSVRGFLQLIHDDENLKSAQKHYIDIALAELDHAQSIINDYLSLAKPNTEGLTTVNISDEVRKTVALMTSYSNIQNISIRMNIQDSLYIKGNKSEIKQVLVNIIKNGIEAMGAGGDLHVDTFEKDGEIIIKITDNGKGMTRSQLDKLGTPFYTTKEKGTGVGLTISFQLIQAMKGSISVESHIGKGTTFTIRFPFVTHTEVVE
ncbi:ATP-binding protein [Neobacillus sp. WH10]|uniref:ATP-binding protein n=1 Tax=Neobacillus sp. WH10 TaxID=3047873 RepID=UPI0024C1F053|nr:ATP-binding protein [Neobacillus sp. WH10]WHY77030.1 ATP-binding protein [Neobacillus sp. WH10]